MEKEEKKEKDLNDEVESYAKLEEEIKKKKCSLKEHEEIDAIIYCQECKIYMCNKCLNHHSQFLKNHKLYKLDNNIIKLFSYICKEKNHNNMKLEYFCENHNVLCCGAFISKIQSEGNGKHNKCKVFPIVEIKAKKKNKLTENINYLKDLSKSIDQTIKQLKTIFETTNKKKEKLRDYVQKVFTKIRNALNEREEQLLLQVDKIYNKLFFKEEMIRKSETLPKKIRISLDKGKIEENEWNNKDKLNLLIYNSICIEKNIEEIKMINESIENAKSNLDLSVFFVPNEDKINKILETIKKFGDIEYKREKVEKIISKFDDEYMILTVVDEDEFKQIIIELNYDEEKIREWIEKILNE